MVPSAGAWRYLQRARSIPSLPAVMGAHSTFFVPVELDLWPWHSNSSERRTKHVLPVNLAQVRSVVPEILEAQTKKNKKSQTVLKTEPYLRAVITTSSALMTVFQVNLSEPVSLLYLFWKSTCADQCLPARETRVLALVVSSVNCQCTEGNSKHGLQPWNPHSASITRLLREGCFSLSRTSSPMQ